MDIGKKGVVFTGAAIIVTTILFTVFYLSEGEQVDSYTDTSLLQLQTSLRVYDDLPRLIELEAQQAIRESVTALAEDVMEQGVLFNQTLQGKSAGSAFLSTCLREGVFQKPSATGTGTVSSQGECTSLEETFSRSAEFIEDNINVDIDYSVKSVKVTEETSYNLRVTGEMEIMTKDAASETSQLVPFEFFTSPEGALSPSYAFTSGLEDRPDDFFIEKDLSLPLTAWSNTTAHSVTENRRFFPYPDAPSLLQRIGGDFTPSDCCGIAMIIHPDGVDNPNNYSHLDYHYWNQDCGHDTRRINMENLSNSERANYGSNNPAIDGAILPLQFIREANLNNSEMLEPVSCS